MIAKLSDLGFDPNPNADNTPAWNAIVAQGGPKWVFVDDIYTFKSRPNPVERCMRIDGLSINGSGLRRDYQPSSLNEPFIHIKSTCKIGTFTITAASGNGGISLLHEGNGASDSVVEDMYISAAKGANWFVTASAWGPDPVMGIRTLHYRNVELFAATAQVFWGTNVRGLTMTDVSFYSAGGSTGQVTFQGEAGGRSANVDITTRYLETLYFYETDGAVVRRLSPVVIHANNSTNIRQQ